MENLIEGIIFDYGGTLDSHGDHWSHVIYESWSEAGVDLPVEIFRDVYVEAERLMARERIILPSDNFGSLMHKKLGAQARFLSERHGVEVDPAAVATASDLCYEKARRCVDEARPILESLAAKVPLVLVSNFYGNIEEVTRDFGVRHLFRGIIESAVVGIRKPDARIFSLGVTVLGCDPEKVLVVGDSLRKDIFPARSLGCQTAWIKGRGWTADEDSATDAAQVGSLAEIEKRFRFA